MKNIEKTKKQNFNKIIGVCFGYVIGFLLLFSILCCSFAPMMVGAVNYNADEVVPTDDTQQLSMYNKNYNGTRWELTSYLVNSETAMVYGMFHVSGSSQFNDNYNYDCTSIIFGFRYDTDYDVLEPAHDYICLAVVRGDGSSSYYVNIPTMDISQHEPFIITVYNLEPYYYDTFERLFDYIKLVYVPSNYNVPINFTIYSDYPLEADPMQYYCYFLGKDWSTNTYPNSAVHLNEFVNNEFNLNINTIANPSNYLEQYNRYGYTLRTRYTGSVPVLKVYEYGTDREVDTILINGETTEYYISPKFYYVLTFTYDSSDETKYGGIIFLIDDVDLSDVNEYYFDIGQNNDGQNDGLTNTYRLFNASLDLSMFDETITESFVVEFPNVVNEVVQRVNSITFSDNRIDAVDDDLRIYSSGEFNVPSFRLWHFVTAPTEADVLNFIYSNSIEVVLDTQFLVTYGSIVEDYFYSIGSQDGYDVGYGEGHTNGYDEGHSHGFDEGASQNFGDNLIGGAFEGITDGISNITLYESSNGTRVTLWVVISGCIGIALFIWVVKLFAGG